MSYIVTYTGRIFDYNDINKDSINIDDIIRSLPRINRFIGHSSRPYSVAEHSLYCYFIAESLGYSIRMQLLALIHDFSEAYVGDCPAPLKSLLPSYSKIESKIESVIYESLEIQPPTKEEREIIKAIDKTLLVIEMRDLTLHDHGEFIDEVVHEEIINDGKTSITRDEEYLELSNEENIRGLLSFALDNLIGKYKEEGNSNE